MHLQWILNPITCYATVALALAGCLALFIATKVELQTVRLMAVSAHDELQEMKYKSAQEVAAPAPELEPEPAAPPSGAGLNLGKRGQALRMHRRGESPAAIATALQAPQSEIQLLLKVHTLLNGRR